MARYDKEHKEQTRRRIVETSARRFKQDGVNASGISTLMADAGLTNGAFYAHFTSKDDLVAGVVADQLGWQVGVIDALPAGRPGIEQIVRTYLSAEHRAQPEQGCPTVALIDEISRSGDTVRQAYTDGLMRVIDAIAARLDPVDPASARVRALTAFAAMAGTMQLARTVTDRQLSDRLLEQGIENALAAFGVTEH